MSRQKKIVIVTTGQPSTNPRMVKEVAALSDAGYDVKVLYSFWARWAVDGDQVFINRFPGVFQEVGGNPVTDKKSYLLSRVIYKGIRGLCKRFSFLQQYALARTSIALKRIAANYQADLYIAHNLGALPAAAAAAAKHKARLGFDAEDYHRGQNAVDDPFFTITCYIEDRFMPQCDYVTAASPEIGKVYQSLFPAARVSVINNVFSKAYLQPIAPKREGPLKLFWFSQTVGPDRGLEAVVEALNQLPDADISLTMLGDCSEVYRTKLKSLARRPEALTFHEPVKSDQLFSIAAGFDIGLSTEMPDWPYRNFCLTNKLFSYLLAGNCVVVSDTAAQEAFLTRHPAVGVLYRHNDPSDLAAQLEKLYNDRSLVVKCREQALALAASSCNWETESQTFLKIIEETMMHGQPSGKAVAIA